ncbi:MAG: RluA family pseudouridine synthase, partial [Oscillospiraceae bacterium]
MINKEIKFIVENPDNLRIDKLLVNYFVDFSRNKIQKLLDDEKVLINKKAVNKKYLPKNGDEIIISIPPLQELENVAAQNLNLDIVYEDSDLLVVNKPKGMVVHPAAGNYENTLVNGLLFHCKDNLSGINGIIRPGIVHRIDKNTSGLLIVAKNDDSHNFLAKQIKEHSFTREYLTIIYGYLKEDILTIDAPIGRNPVDRKKMAVTTKNSKNAITVFETIKKFNGFSLLKCTLQTGRTHQIRVHLASVGHPVVGDDVYGPKKVITELHGQCLHAQKIGFIHPRTNEYLEFSSPLPEYFQAF